MEYFNTLLNSKAGAVLSSASFCLPNHFNPGGSAKVPILFDKSFLQGKLLNQHFKNELITQIKNWDSSRNLLGLLREIPLLNQSPYLEKLLL